MELQLKTVGELTDQMLLNALYTFLKKRGNIESAVVEYLNSEHKIRPSAITITEEGQTPKVRFEVGSTPLNIKESGSKVRKRKNQGFYQQLTNYLQRQKKKGKKQVTMQEAFKQMQKIFPTLTERLFIIYAFDKRQQKSKGFSYDGQERIFNL